MTERGLRYNAGKARLDLVTPSAMLAIAEVASFGAQKYLPRNWEKGMPYGESYASCLRHLFAWWNGEDTDPESGVNHLNHALWNIAALIEFERLRKANRPAPGAKDDRPYKESNNVG